MNTRGEYSTYHPELNGELLFRDPSHMTLAGARVLGKIRFLPSSIISIERGRDEAGSGPAGGKSMGVRLNAEEVSRFLEQGHTGILTTLRRDGFPVSLPTWYVADDGRIYCQTPIRTKKMARIQHDPRASFLVESGLAWAELKAVMLYGRICVVEDQALRTRVADLVDDKYGAFRTATTKQPETTQDHYASVATLRFDPEGEPITWDNAKMKLRS